MKRNVKIEFLYVLLFEKNAGKKPKALPKQDDRILVSPVVNKDKFGKKAKLEALETEPLALTVAGAISCLIGSNQSFLVS